MSAAEYRSLIREVPDFPKPGILFYDITTLLKDPKAFAAIADEEMPIVDAIQEGDVMRRITVARCPH